MSPRFFSSVLIVLLTSFANLSFAERHRGSYYSPTYPANTGGTSFTDTVLLTNTPTERTVAVNGVPVPPNAVSYRLINGQVVFQFPERAVVAPITPVVTPPTPVIPTPPARSAPDIVETGSSSTPNVQLSLTEKDLKNAIRMEYYSNETNYCHADDCCWIRAKKMISRLSETGIDLRGPDHKWGTGDDIVKQIVIRYPEGARWRYHIASVAVIWKDGKKEELVLDPIGGRFETFTPQDWAERFAHGDKIEFKNNTDATPPADTVYVAIVPGNQSHFESDSFIDIYTDKMDGAFTRCNDRICGHIRGLLDKGITPYPSDWEDRRREIEPEVRAYNENRKLGSHGDR